MNARLPLQPPGAATRAPVRLLGLDLARALAIVGMVWVNFRMFVHGAGPTPPWAELLDGRAAALFVVLAGVGVSLMARSKSVAAARSVLWKRAVVLALVGYAWADVWVADILHFYGVWLALAALVVGWSGRRLVALAIGGVGVATAMLWTFDYTQSWDLTTMAYADFWTVRGQLRNLFFNGLHPTFPWMMLLLGGMVLGRTNLGSPTHQRRLLTGGLAVWAGVEVGSDVLVAATTDVLGADVAPFVFGTDSMPPSFLYILASGSLAVAMVGGSLMVARRFEAKRWVRALVHLGQLSLSVYILHAVVALLGLTFLEGGSVLGVVLPLVVSFVAVVVPGAHLWRTRFPRGPFETLLRRVAA
jgi:uncharacterized protein